MEFTPNTEIMASSKKCMEHEYNSISLIERAV
jgi:hypothetical protein